MRTYTHVCDVHSNTHKNRNSIVKKRASIEDWKLARARVFAQKFSAGDAHSSPFFSLIIIFLFFPSVVFRR